MIVSLKEFKADPVRYLELVDEEELVITKEGRRDAMPQKSSLSPSEKIAILHSLRGILPADITDEEAREARMAKHEKNTL